jgi:hypothetical protein
LQISIPVVATAAVAGLIILRQGGSGLSPVKTINNPDEWLAIKTAATSTLEEAEKRLRFGVYKKDGAYHVRDTGTRGGAEAGFRTYTINVHEPSGRLLETFHVNIPTSGVGARVDATVWILGIPSWKIYAFHADTDTVDVDWDPDRGLIGSITITYTDIDGNTRSTPTVTFDMQ